MPAPEAPDRFVQLIAREGGMLDASTFDRLEPGDQLELPGLFKGLTGEPVRLLVTAREPHRIEVEGSYFGVPVGRWTARLDAGVVTWRVLEPGRQR
jgi:hypothetical protein